MKTRQKHTVILMFLSFIMPKSLQSLLKVFEKTI